MVLRPPAPRWSILKSLFETHQVTGVQPNGLTHQTALHHHPAGVDKHDPVSLQLLEYKSLTAKGPAAQPAVVDFVSLRDASCSMAWKPNLARQI